ncbi:PREDICTED: putative F-box protein At3g10240 [Theobroma cacao]|uniref:F-box protein At3g10240 n=1 Tax=Theobroma cacao TaxID=3641 RepID=A0AB32X0H1_THECC|nr:PREDICTED: putative F-box protein At3g10240 [Theobroma cacao]
MSMPIIDKELPDILVMEILLRLPVKSLIRFKCVCKSWCFSFQTPYFITNHKNDNLNLLFKDFKISRFSPLSTETKIKRHGGPDVEFNLKVKENIHMPVSICNSSRSRLTVFGVCNGLLCLQDGYRITLWNPSTREVKLLPKSTISLPPSVESTYFHCMGFEFDPKSDDYKVLVNVINRVHDEERIISAECFWYIASFNEALAIIVYPRRGMEKCYDIWVLNGYLWTKQLTIGPILGVGRPLGFWKNGELFLESENHKLVMFDPCTRELQDFGIHMPKYRTQLIVYAESIVPIRGSSEYMTNITREVQLQV